MFYSRRKRRRITAARSALPGQASAHHDVVVAMEDAGATCLAASHRQQGVTSRANTARQGVTSVGHISLPMDGV